MARVGIVFGLILCGITVVGLVGSPIKNPTQFYAMMLGIPILFCGVVALNPHRRRLAMLVAACIALTGVILGAFWSGFQFLSFADGNGEINAYAVQLITGMTAVCLVFLGFCVIGLKRLRRRSAQQMPPARTMPWSPPSEAFPPPSEAGPIEPAAVDSTLPHDPDVPTSREIA
jgi:hypothetical protein